MSLRLDEDMLTALQAPDQQHMLKKVQQAPQRGQQCLSLGRQQAWQAPAPRHILICGMGGSGSTGDLLQAICHKARIPVLVNKNATLPAWVGSDSLVIGISYSGNTAETLSCLTQAAAAGAQRLGLACGGEVERRAQQEGFPLLKIAGGLPPRAALFDMLFALLGCLESLQALQLDPIETEQVLTDLSQLPWFPQAGQPEPLPLEIANSLAVHDDLRIWGVSGQTEALAWRWKNQLSENAKTLASVSLLPELNHNEVVAVCARHHSQSQLIYLTLETSIPASEAIVLDLVRAHVASILTIPAPEGSRLKRLLYLVYLGDFISVYLALLKGTNPTPIAAIEELKRRMA